MRSCSRFLMISRQSAAFSINLQTLLLLGETASPGVTPPSQALGLTRMEMLLQRTVENSFGENSPARGGVRLLFQITHRPRTWNLGAALCSGCQWLPERASVPREMGPHYWLPHSWFLASTSSFFLIFHVLISVRLYFLKLDQNIVDFIEKDQFHLDAKGRIKPLLLFEMLFFSFLLNGDRVLTLTQAGGV